MISVEMTNAGGDLIAGRTGVVEIEAIVVEIEITAVREVTEVAMIGNVLNAITITSLGEIPAIVALQNALRIPELVTVEDTNAGTTEAVIAEVVAVDTEVVEIVTTAVETVVTIEVKIGVTIEAELSAEELVTGGIAMAGQGEVEDIIERKPIPIILLERTETIDYQRVSPQSLQYFSPRLSSLFTEYFLHSGQGGKPVFSFLTLLNLRGIGKRGQPFFGLRTFGILPPNLDKT